MLLRYSRHKSRLCKHRKSCFFRIIRVLWNAFTGNGHGSSPSPNMFWLLFCIIAEPSVPIYLAQLLQETVEPAERHSAAFSGSL